jgi:hypothetical protein
MTEQERREHALRIATQALQDLDYLSVVEDWDLEDAGGNEEDWIAIHDLIRDSKAVLPE